MNQKYVMALVDDDAFCIRADGMNVVSFIKEYGELEDIAIMTMHRYPLLNTRGGFVDRCFDQEYLAKQLLPCLIPIRQEQIPPAEIDYLKSWDLLPENAAPVPDWDCDKGHGIWNLDIPKPDHEWSAAEEWPEEENMEDEGIEP